MHCARRGRAAVSQLPQKCVAFGWSMVSGLLRDRWSPKRRFGCTQHAYGRHGRLTPQSGSQGLTPSSRGPPFGRRQLWRGQLPSCTLARHFSTGLATGFGCLKGTSSVDEEARGYHTYVAVSVMVALAESAHSFPHLFIHRVPSAPRRERDHFVTRGARATVCRMHSSRMDR